MLSKPKQFEPERQVEAATVEFDDAIQAAEAAVSRLQRLRNRLASEIENLRSEREQLEIYTEEEAAEILKIERPQLLADLRRRHDLPHFLAGREPRYTKEHLAEICRRLEVNSRAKGGKASYRHAA